MSGIFITFEGGEGAGKTTLIESIAKTLESRDYQILKSREPGGTELGEEIRHILLQGTKHLSSYAELCLFLASRAQHIKEVIGPALEEGKIVLCDRFNDSSIAYQGAARGLGMAKVSEFCQFISQGLNPQLTLYLDLLPELGLLRAASARKQDRIESETIPFHHKIREAYLEIHHLDPQRFRLIDATKKPEEVYFEAMKWVDLCLKK